MHFCLSKIQGVPFRSLNFNQPTSPLSEIHEVNALNLLVHGGNSVIIVVELAVTSHPVRMAHALYGAGAGLLYGVFSALYWALGGTDRLGARAIYPSLDWSRPGK